MRLSASRLALRLAAAVLLTSSASAQAPPAASAEGFEAYPAYNEISAITSGLGRLWAAAPGGLFSYDPVSGEIDRTTTIDGLRGGNVVSLTVDEARGTVWAGYADGVLDRLTAADGSVRTFYDIERNAQFAARGVRRLRVRGDTLYAATDFGLVVFDLVRSEVRNTYARLADLPPATPVNDLVLAPLPDGAPGLWLATDAGVVYARADSPTLQAPTAWTRDPGFAVGAIALAAFPGPSGALDLYVSGGSTNARDLYVRREDGTYDRLTFDNLDVTALVPDGDRLLSLTIFGVRASAPGAVGPLVRAFGAESLTGLTVGPTGRRWASDASLGLFPLPDTEPAAPLDFEPEPVVPPGPFSNDLRGIDVAQDGTVWAISGPVPAAQSSAVNRLDPDTGEWTALLTREMPEALGTAPLSSVSIGPDDAVYVGTAGDGLAVIRPDGDITRYDETNSTLNSASSNDPSFVVVSDVAFEGPLRWVANQEALQGGLNLLDEDDTWARLPFPTGIAGGAGRSTIAVDRLGQKWLNVGRGGLIVWDTGSTPADPSDDRVRQYRGQGDSPTGLPNPEVRDVAVDGDGVVWIGTRRGLATVFSPGSAFGDPSLAVPQWTLTPAGTDGARDFFLRDVEVNDLDPDPSGRIWVATTSGAYLVAPSPSGSGFVVAREINSGSSPLPDDNVLRIAVRPGDGRVFLTTPSGLFSVAGDATQPVAASESLRASPSPFRPAEAPNGVVVSGLASARSTVRVLTLSGEMIHEGDVAGGSFRWNGRDDRTGEVVASGVYLVTATDADGQAVVGKIAVIR